MKFHNTINEEEFKLLKTILGDKLDDLDIKIYMLLKDNGRLTDTEISEKLGVSITTVRRRRKEMQRRGYLQILGLISFEFAKIAYADVIVKINVNSPLDEINDFIKDCLSAPYVYEVTEYVGNHIFLGFYEKDLKSLNNAINQLLQNRKVIDDYSIFIVSTSPKIWNKVIYPQE